MRLIEEQVLRAAKFKTKCAVYMGSFESYLGRILCKTRLIFPRLNDPNVENH